MAQQYLMFNDYTAPMVDEDGYQVDEAVTSASNRKRTMRGGMKGGVLFTVEAYNLKWTNISCAAWELITSEKTSAKSAAIPPTKSEISAPISNKDTK